MAGRTLLWQRQSNSCYQFVPSFSRVATICPDPDPVEILDGLLYLNTVLEFEISSPVFTLSIYFPSACSAVTLIGASAVLFMPAWPHAISAVSASGQPKEMQLCRVPRFAMLSRS